MDEYYKSGVSIAGFFGSLVVIVLVTGYISSLQLDYNQATITHTYMDSGTSACVFSLHGNIDSDKPCAYHVGDNVTVFHNGMGVWRIKQ